LEDYLFGGDLHATATLAGGAREIAKKNDMIFLLQKTAYRRGDNLMLRYNKTFPDNKGACISFGKLNTWAGK